MPRRTPGNRLAAAAAGAIFGGLVGFLLAWRSRNPAGLLYLKHWVVFCAAGFGAVGLLFGPFVGSVINTIFKLEDTSFYGISRGTALPTWLVIILLLSIIAVVWWSAT